MNHTPTLEPPLLEVRDLTVRYAEIAAVRDVSFRLQPGEALGIVGESSGKSSIAGAILDFLWPCGTDRRTDPCSRAET
jgi:ABC-type glutathione transport system ATPase component